MSVGFKRAHDHGSGFTSRATIDAVEKAIRSKVKVVRGVDIPYAAGYSTDGKTVYIDRAVPKTFDLHGRPCDVTRYLVIHEAVEKALMDALGLPYAYAHALATTCEEKAVQADGYDLAAYNAAWDKIIRTVGSRGKYPDVPKDLDTQAYTQDHDVKDEREMGMIGGKTSYATIDYGG
jgi:hypothetical protein